MAKFNRHAVKVKEVLRYEGPGAKKGDECAYFNVYVHDDDSCHTIEFSRSGAHIAEYDGEPVFPDDRTPRPLDEGVPPRTAPVAPKSGPDPNRGK